MKTQDNARQWGEPLWQPRRLTSVTEPIPRAIDVAIIGGGLTGMSAAFHLACGGLRAVVFEKASVGNGASGRTGGIVLEGTATGIRPGAETCVPALARLVEELGIGCDLHLPGCWEIEHQPGSGGSALPWIDGGNPIRIARTVAGGSVEPRALLFGLAEAAQRRGAVIREHTAVRKIRLHDPAVEVDGAVIAAAHIVVAVNAWVSSLLPGLPQIHSALTYACATEPLPDHILCELGLGEHIPFYTADRPYLWGRVAAQGEIVFGAGLKYGVPQALEQDGIDSGGAQAILQELTRRVRELNPVLARVRIPSKWTGPIAFTDQALPLIGAYPPNSAILIAAAYAGHGVAFSVHAGALIASAILHDTALPEWGAIAGQP
ncbi:MAG: FAD-binding oxidoreductase [Deltaproteobacteria bacterium]|nr:FAD-binding oxidoreductase [Deltaproteobacteria bacterium]